jgi:hypothetical protein
MVFNFKKMRKWIYMRTLKKLKNRYKIKMLQINKINDLNKK